MDDLFVGFVVALAIVDVPAEGFEEGVEEFAAELGLAVAGLPVLIAMQGEALDEIDDGVGGRVRGGGFGVGHGAASRVYGQGRTSRLIL